MKTTVVNLYEDDGYDVYIGRGTSGDGYFGNPFPVRSYGRDGAIERYRHYFALKLLHNPEFKRQVEALRGKVLGCYCKPLPCHGDVIADYLNALPSTAPEP